MGAELRRYSEKTGPNDKKLYRLRDTIFKMKGSLSGHGKDV